MDLQVQRVEHCLEWLETNGDKYETIQSLTVLIEDLGTLVKSLAFVNNQMAVAKRMLNEAKTREYTNLIASQRAIGWDMSPMLARDYINAKVSKEMFDYDVCERCSRTITHTIDALRTCISALKIEQQYSNYQM